MAIRRSIVLISGQETEIPIGDTIDAGVVGSITAGSGLDGGGTLPTETTINVLLAPNPSGLGFVDNKYLADDGAAQRLGESALASGNYALSVGSTALASGVAGSTLAGTAQASGNAALAGINAAGDTVKTFTAAGAISPGYAVGLDDAGRVQSVRITAGVIYPTVSTKTNFIGIAQTAASSGLGVQVRLPGTYDRSNTSLTPGAVYYVDPTTSGFTTTSGQPPAWSGAVSWAPIGWALNSTTLILTAMV